MRNLQWLLVLLIVLQFITSFSLTSAQSSPIITLQPGGIPTFVEFNNSLSVQFFRVTSSPINGSLHIRATPIWGADWVHVYINTVETGLPGPHNSTWFWDQGYNGEIITIPNTTSTWSASNTFYIGLYFTGENYNSVNAAVDVAVWHHNSSCYLYHFNPVQGRTHQGHYSYYVVNTTLFVNDTTTNTTVMLTKLSGQSNSTILLYSFTNQYPTLNDPDTIIVTDYIVGSYFFVIPNTVAQTFVYVAVYGNENSTYTIVPTYYFADDNATFTGHLKDGIPQFGVVGVTTAYYHFQPKHLNTTTLITLNTITNNVIDAFITTSDTGYYPARNQSLWNTTFEGGNTIGFIPHNDPRACQNYSCYYILAIALRPGLTQFAEFYVTVTQRERITYLQNGVIALGDSRPVDSNYTYFVAPVDTVGHHIRFEILPLDGYEFATAFISTTTAYPNNTYFDYVTSGSSTYAGITRIAPADATCTPTLDFTCYYFIAVESYGNTSFEIVYNVAEPVTLRSGLYLYENLGLATGNGVYRFNVNPGYGHVALSISDAFGDSSINLYISNSAVIPNPADPTTYQIFIPYTAGSEKLVRIEESDVNNTACTFSNSSTSIFKHCTYTFLIQPVENYTYVEILVSTFNSTIELLDDVPVRTIGRANTPDYYFFRNANSSRDIVFQIQNAGIVYITNMTSRPDVTHYTYYLGDETGMNKIVIPSSGFWYLAVYPFDGIEYTLLAFTVAQNNSNDTSVIRPIQAGIPLTEDYLPANYTHYYEFFIPNNTYVVILELTTHVGAPSLSCNWGPYNATLPFPSSNFAMAIGYSFHFNSIYLPQPYGGKYLCAVYANYSTTAAYDIVYNVYYPNSSSSNQLLDGRIVEGFAANNFPRYYQIAMPLNLTLNGSDWITPYELRVSLTGYTGDPVFYVSTRPYPSYTNYMWRSYDAGSAAIHVSPDDPNWCPIGNSGVPCTYYIAVHTTQNAFFRVFATFSRFHSPIVVHNSVTINAINSHISTTKFIYNPLNYEIGRDIRMAASPAYGAAYIYVNVLNITSGVMNLTMDLFPSPWNYTFSSYGDFAGSFVHIHANDSFYCNNSNLLNPGAGERTSCVYLITVAPIDPISAQLLSNATVNATVNATIPCQFTFYIESVVADAATDMARPVYYDGIHRMIDHVPVWRFLDQNTLHYYKFENANPGQDMFVTFTPIMGFGEMFVSYAPVAYPTNITAVFSTVVNNTHTFNFQSLNQTIYNNNTIIFVAIRAYTNLTYTIVGGQNGALNVTRYPTRLTDGVPQYDTLSDLRPNSWRYYVFYLPVNDSISVSVPRRMGDVELYIKYQPFNISGGFSQYPAPNATYYDYAMNHHGLDAFKIPFAPAGRYVIGVFAKWRTDYALIVTAAYTANILFFDQPVTGHLIVPSVYPDGTATLYNRTAAYYIVPITIVSQFRDLVVDVTIYTGIATVFISDQPHIDPHNISTYLQSSSHDRLNNMVIPNAMLRQGPYFILVVSALNTTYSIVATYKEYQQLQMGLPANGYAIANDTHYFHLTLAGYPHDVSIMVQPEHGKGHVFANDVTTQWNVPNPFDNTSYTYSSRDPFNAAQHLFISNSQCNYTRCTYLIALHALEFADFRYNIYVVPINTTQFNNATILLQGTVPQIGFTQYTNDSIATVGYSHYEFYVPSNLTRVVLTVSPYTYGGWVNIAVGRQTFPQVVFNGINQSYSFLYADWIQNNNSVELTFDYTDPKLVGTDMSGHYYVTVYSLSDVTSSAYTIALNIIDNFTAGTNHSSMYLIDGAMQWGHLPNISDVYHLYELWVPFVNLTTTPDFHRRPTSFTLTSPTNAQLQMFVNWDGTIPTPDNHAAKTNGSYNDCIVIPPLYGCDNTIMDCRYLVTVYNYNPSPNGSIYFVTGTSELGGLTALWPGIEQFGFVYNGFPGLFVFNKMAHDAQQLKVGLTPLSDIPIEAFIGHNQFPTPDNYTFRTLEFGGVIIGSTPAADAGSWVIAVFPPPGIENASTGFRLTVSSRAVLLTNVPYGDVLFEGQQSLYVVDLQSNPNPLISLVVKLNPSVDTTAVNMYIAKADVHNLPSASNYIVMSSPESENANSLVLNSETPGFISTGIYYVIVEGVSANSSYEISATTSAEPFVIEDGKDVTAPYPLSPSQFVVYRYQAIPNVNYPLDLLVSVEKYYGALLLCVGYNVSEPTNTTANTNCTTMLNFEAGKYIVIPKTQVQFGFYYISLTVLGNVPSYFGVMVTMAIPQLSSGFPVPGLCDPSTYPPAYYMNIGAVDRITFDVIPLGNFTIFPELQLYISNNRSNRFPGANNATWSATVSFNSPFAISKADTNLMTCVSNPTTSCTLFIVIGGCTEIQNFRITATVGNFLVPLSSDDLRNGLVPASDYDYYSIEVTSDFPTAFVEIEQCYGLTYGYYSSTNKFPSSTSYDNSSVSTTTSNYFDLSSRTTNVTRTYYVSVYGAQIQHPTPLSFATYRISTRTYKRNPPTLPAFPQLTQQKTTEDASVSFSFALVTPSSDNANLTYAVFADGRNDPNAIYFTLCGLEEATLVKVYSQADLEKIATDGHVTITVNDLDDNKQYAFIVMVSAFGNETNPGGSSIYTPLTKIFPTPSKSGGDHKGYIIALGVIIPIVVICLSVAIYFYCRNRRLKQELTVELPDVASSRSGQFKKRAVRGSNVGSSSFSRNNDNYQTSLLDDNDDPVI